MTSWKRPLWLICYLFTMTGKIVQRGNPQEIISQPLTPEVAALVQLPDPILPYDLLLSEGCVRL